MRVVWNHNRTRFGETNTQTSRAININTRIATLACCWNLKRAKKELVIASIVLSGMIASVYAVGLFTHNFPGIQAVSVLTTACGTGSSKLIPSNPGPIPTGSTGTILFNCPPPTGSNVNGPALTAAAAATTTPSVSATLPTGVTLALVSYVQGATTCTAGTGTPIASGTPITFGGAGPATGDYNYCMSYTAFPSGGIPAFSITWSQ